VLVLLVVGLDLLSVMRVWESVIGVASEPPLVLLEPLDHEVAGSRVPLAVNVGDPGRCGTLVLLVETLQQDLIRRLGAEDRGAVPEAEQFVQQLLDQAGVPDVPQEELEIKQQPLRPVSQ